MFVRSRVCVCVFMHMYDCVCMYVYECECVRIQQDLCVCVRRMYHGVAILSITLLVFRVLEHCL